MQNEKIAIVSADYEEWKPETFKGYVVHLDDAVFQDLDDAIQYAHKQADKVYLSSTVENYQYDLEDGCN